MTDIDFDNLFLMTEDIPTCPKCGSRTDLVLDFSHKNESTQIHKCLAPDCSFEFVLVDDLEFSKKDL